MKRVLILAVGSELLTPYHQDTNSLYLSERLNSLGLEVSFKTIVGDDESDLVLMLEEAARLADLILVMGGLGPTADDRTRDAAARAFGLKLIPAPEVLGRIEARFKRRGLPMPDSKRKQGLVLEGSEVLPNEVGTAPGLWLDWRGKTVVLLPGPPHELKSMFDRQVLPRLEPLREGFLRHISLKIAGLTESAVEDRMTGLYPRDTRLKITTLARPGQIELHLRSFSVESPEDARARMKPLEDALLAEFGEDVFSTGGESLEEVVGCLLRARNKTLACAESCTGGLIGHRLTNVPGSSEFFLGGMTVYSNGAKTKWLGVPEDVLAEAGAVSERTAAAMASCVRWAAGADFGLAVTGIAGPGGGSAEKPVGFVHAALAWDGGLDTAKNLFLGNRDLVKFQSSQKALDMLRRRLMRGRS